MAQFSPQYNPHKLTARVRTVNNWIFWIIFILSFLPVFPNKYTDSELCKTCLSILNIICILLFFTLEIIADFILFPQSEQKRRDDFLDNSFGSRFASENSIGYYNNENVAAGLYKAACNMFENTFFTYSLVKAITLRKVLFPSIVLISVWVLAFFGFNKVPMALSILQFLFSANVLGNMIKHLILLNKTSTIYDNWITTFQIQDFKQSTLKYQSSIYRNWLNYETTLSRIQPETPDKFFQKHNPRLTREWESMKTKYGIN